MLRLSSNTMHKLIVTILFFSFAVSVHAQELNCKVTVLHEGAVLAEGSLDHVTRNTNVIDVYLGRG